MTVEETTKFMKRIKQHYQDFVIDNYKIEEWYKELKNYTYDDVNKKLEEHLKSQQFGNQIPKVYFLTRYLTPEKEKIKNKASNLWVRCSLCGKVIKYLDFQTHMDRCNSVEFINLQSKKLFSKEIDKQRYREMPDEDFDKIYNKLLERILQTSKNKDEIERIENYMIGNNYAR